ncbi:MAG: extracellular solute-binding protein [Paracoccaceae bacterium]
MTNRPTARILGATALTALALPAVAQDTDILVFDYPGYEEPAYHGAYIEAHGDSPAFAFFGDEEEAFQKIVSGFRADVTHICAGSVAKWIDSGIIEPWDTSRVDAYADLNSDLVGVDVAAGEELYFLPIDFGSTAVAYNPEEVTEDQVASLDVFTNPEFAGRLSLPDNVDDAYALAYLATGTTDWTQATPEQFDAASAWLREVHPNLRTYWTDPAELSQLMSTGEVLVSWAWNETYPTMQEEGRPIAFQREAAEGSSLWLCGYVNMADGPGSEDKVYDYVNAVLAPDSTLPLLDAGFGHANQAAMDALTDYDFDAVGLGEIDAPILAQLPMDQDLRDQQSETFELIKAGF